LKSTERSTRAPFSVLVGKFQQFRLVEEY